MALLRSGCAFNWPAEGAPPVVCAGALDICLANAGSPWRSKKATNSGTVFRPIKSSCFNSLAISVLLAPPATNDFSSCISLSCTVPPLWNRIKPPCAALRTGICCCCCGICGRPCWAIIAPIPPCCGGRCCGRG